MRPSSFNYNPSDYDVERNKRFLGWEKEVREIIAKIHGSSLKPTDKKKALNRIKSELSENIARYA
jgi:hypothetical protein